MSNVHKFPYKWYLKDGYPAKGIAKHSAKVFGTFICGGGSTMGYKLAGYEHLGGVEIDKVVAKVYQANHSPKYLYNEDIRLFLERKDIPEELFNLDLLDGSPPCSSFSMAGNREKDWNKNKVFREGQADQKLDDLFFTYIELAKKLQPKVVLAENVKGLIQGNAKFYVSRIKKEFEKAGYKVQLFLLNAASMGVPQRRERVFFICLRNDIKLPELKLNFQEPAIPFEEATKELTCIDFQSYATTDLSAKYWNMAKEGDSLSKVHPTGSWYNHIRLSSKNPMPTLMGDGKAKLLHPTECRRLTLDEWRVGGSYPMDYNFTGIDGQYLIGMSVPPVMTAHVAHQIYLQWLSKL